MSVSEEQVRSLYVPGVFGITRVAKELGTSRTTVRRILYPEYRERLRIMSLEAKRRRTGVCSECGGETRYNGRNGKTVSIICADCSERIQREARIWTREAVIEAIQRWAAEHGRPPSATDWDNAGSDHPAKSNVYRSVGAQNNPFEYWADAIEAAGFERPETGGRYRERPWLQRFDHAEIMRLLGQGLNGAEVARRVGCSQQLVSALKRNNGTTAQRRGVA